MKKISMISTALLSSALVACGGGSGSPDKVDLCSEVGATNCNQIVLPSSSSSSSTNSSSSSSVVPPRNNILPISEKFAVDDALQLFTPTYKSLLEPGTEDLNPSFYYSTSGLDAGRIVARNGQMTIGNARMTLGQRLQSSGTHINPAALPADFKINTTTEPTAANTPTTTTWGELDLSQPWKISFCVNEREASGATASNQQFMVYVDNNQSSASLSIHGTKSLVKQLNVTNFVAGKRVEINIPGDVLVDGKSIDSVLDNAGTATSFIQLRVPSAGIVTMSELWVGYQSDKTTEPTAATCAPAARVSGYGVAPAAAAPTTAPTAVAGDSQLEVSWTELARATTYQVAHNMANTADGATVSADITGTTYSIKDLQNNQAYYVFYRGKNSAGAYTAWSPSVTATPVAALIAPVAPQAPTLVAGDAQIEVSWAAVDGASTYQVGYSETNDAATVTAFGDPVSATTATITGLTNGTTYFVFVKAQNTAGDSAYSPATSDTPVAPSTGTDVSTNWASFDATTYASILSLAPGTANNPITQSAIAYSINGLSFFHDTTGTLRHRGGANLEWNFNGSGWASGNPVTAVGEDAAAQRAYISVPVEAGRAVTLTVVHRNSSSGLSGPESIVFVGSDGKILHKSTASSNVATTTTFSLLAGHVQTEVKILFSREGGAGGMHVTSIDKTYN